jgi:hypothetical protein
MYLRSICLIGMSLSDMYLTGFTSHMGVYLMGVHLIGGHFIGVHVIL